MKRGDKVQINPNGNFPTQGLDYYNNPLIGIITRLDYLGFEYNVLWSNGDDYLYNKNDIILLDQSQDYEIY